LKEGGSEGGRVEGGIDEGEEMKEGKSERLRQEEGGM
jgi:hypothetical protein